MADSSGPQHSPISLRTPSRYAAVDVTSVTGPPLEWLYRTWSVTHSTLSLWRSARNVRITYSPLPASSPSSPPRMGDQVEYEARDGKSSGVSSVVGVDTAGASAPGASPSTCVWNWRGRGWLFFVTSKWEVLGWGERPLGSGANGDGEQGVERWIVTWFAPTLFTKEGVDVYSDRREGGSPELVEEILQALKTHKAKPLAEMCEKDMRPVQINLPWEEKK
ncbi:hypothetical protein VTK73DRAFT_8496 [Phialemonium thermophilum]|uniref:Uncharacterized protein n=1 Tax=Phialemonium thermophilum TaxID=223376 RepID=A0ABR3XPX8_9PEZI